MTEREQWLKERLTGIGGSEASSLLGKNPYMNNQELFDLKTGLKQRQDISNESAVKYGINAENPLRELFALDFPQYEVIHEPYKIYRNKDYPFILGSFDGVLKDKETGEFSLLEIKTTNILQSMAMERWNERLPDNYFIQCLHYLLVSGFNKIILKAQLKREYKGELKLETRHYTMNRTDYLPDIEYLKNKEIDFWKNNVLKNIRPSLILPI